MNRYLVNELRYLVARSNLELLDPMERSIVLLRLGKDQEGVLRSQQEVARCLGITQTRVSIMEREAKGKLKALMSVEV